jgi:hypothetical protein
MGTPFWQQILLKKRGEKIGITRFSESGVRGEGSGERTFFESFQLNRPKSLRGFQLDD